MTRARSIVELSLVAAPKLWEPTTIISSGGINLNFALFTLFNLEQSVKGRQRFFDLNHESSEICKQNFFMVKVKKILTSKIMLH